MKNENENENDFNGLEIDKENSIVSYNDKLHKYWIKGTDQTCISVTTLIHKFSTFDEDFWSSYKALESLAEEEKFKNIKPDLLNNKVFNNRYLDMTGIREEDFFERKQEILNEWAEKREASCIRGTAIHRQHELEHLAGKTKELSHLGLSGKFSTNTTNILEYGTQNVYPELLLSHISSDNKLRLAGQADLVIIDGFDVWILDYKGLPLDTPILTTKGFKLLKELTKEDIIFDKDGNQTNILNISEVHNNPCYTIEFDNGETITCDHEHRWPISFRRGTGKYKDVVITTEELEKAFLKYQKSKNVYDLPKILNPKPLNIEEVKLPLDPYIFGAWLGDGTSVAGSITNVNPDFWKEVNNRGYTYGDNIAGENKAEQHTIFNIRGILNDLGVLNNKHLPDLYLLSSYKQRLDILRGIMDTDGYYNPTRKRFVMTTTKKWQVECMVKLLGSLGVKSSIIYAKKYCNGKIFDGWDVCFTMLENPFLIRNQEGIEYPKTDKASFRNITAIYKVNTIPTQCLEVDSPSHTFLVGHSLLPTHNTNKKIDLKAYFDRKTRKHSTMKYPLNNIQDTNFWHYSLQLSTYAWMIQKNNPDFNIKGLILIHYDHDDNCTTYECEYLKQDVERMLGYYKNQIEYDEFKKSREKILF
jgi:hypothetical protein